MPDGYTTIEVEGVETYDVHNDFNSRLENIVFDQTARGARARVEARGDDDFVIRNVAFKGVVDSATSYTDSAQIKPAVHNPDGEGLIENVYLGDGTVGGTEINGVLVDYRHAGTLTIRNCHVARWTDNGLYCSDPGYYSTDAFDAQGGTVHIESCYATHNNISQFRIGSDGSTVEDSVAVVTSMGEVPVHANGGHRARGVRMHHSENNECINCDITATAVGAAVQSKDGGGGTLTNCRIDGEILDAEGPIYGGIVGAPSTTPPDSVPMTANEAVTDGGTTTEPPGTTFEIITPDGGDEIVYSFTADGPIAKFQTTDQIYAGGNDEIVDNGDGTYTASGRTANGYGDAYKVAGNVTEWIDNTVAFTLRWGGSEVSTGGLVSDNSGDDGDSDNGSGGGDGVTKQYVDDAISEALAAHVDAKHGKTTVKLTDEQVDAIAQRVGEKIATAFSQPDA